MENNAPLARDRGVQRLLREPLLHFLVIGVVLFAGIAGVRSLQRPTVRIDAREIEQLATYWSMQTQRQPTHAELAAIIRERVDEELQAREAVRLGLDRDDMIVRRRLAQKMAFASEDVAAIPEPSESALQAFYDRNKVRYATPARLALRHVFFSADRTGNSPDAAATEALAALKAGHPTVGDPSLLPQTYADIAITDLARDYGGDFVQAARVARAGTWVGPVASPYGLHLIRVEARLAPLVPPLAAVRSDVRAAWIAERREANNRASLARLRRRYRVQIAGVPE